MDATKELSNLDPLKRELLEARLTGSNKVRKMLIFSFIVSPCATVVLNAVTS